jgi:hypothetical protein
MIEKLCSDRVDSVGKSYRAVVFLYRFPSVAALALYDIKLEKLIGKKYCLCKARFEDISMRIHYYCSQ